MEREPDWTWPELLLLAELGERVGWTQTLREDHPGIIEVSKQLRMLHPDRALNPRYRNTNGAKRKFDDIRTARPGYPGKRTKGGKLTARVSEIIYRNPILVEEFVQSFRQDPTIATDPYDPVVGENLNEPLDDVSSIEGAIIRRLVLHRERSQSLRRAKIAAALASNGDICCEICTFDFERSYGEIGRGYIHVHHLFPLHLSGQVRSGLDDLVLMCANCHAMAHRGPNFRTPGELKEALKDR